MIFSMKAYYLLLFSKTLKVFKEESFLNKIYKEIYQFNGKFSKFLNIFIFKIKFNLKASSKQTTGWISKSKKSLFRKYHKTFC